MDDVVIPAKWSSGDRRWLRRCVAIVVFTLVVGGLVVATRVASARCPARVERAAVGATVVWYELHQQSRRIAVDRYRFARVTHFARASSNSLPPLLIQDNGARFGDCYLARETAGAPGALNASTCVAGCVWWW